MLVVLMWIGDLIGDLVVKWRFFLFGTFAAIFGIFVPEPWRYPTDMDLALLCLASGIVAFLGWAMLLLFRLSFPRTKQFVLGYWFVWVWPVIALARSFEPT